MLAILENLIMQHWHYRKAYTGDKNFICSDEKSYFRIDIKIKFKWRLHVEMDFALLICIITHLIFRNKML